MKQKKRMKNKNVLTANIALFSTLFLFLLLLFRVGYLALSERVDGINLTTFANNRTIKHETILAKRGAIYDVNGNVLAQNVYSYTLIAYLSSSRGDGNYVKNKEETAEKLATVINMDYDKILALLNKNLYQTEFGTAGKGLTELTKDKIVALNLDGIDFIETQKRYYPNGKFLSYTLGYAKLNETGKIIGEMGIEYYLNSLLTGTDGYREYQKDLKGYKIANTQEKVVDSLDGNNVYLTIDSNVQFFIEQALDEVSKKYKFEEINIVVAEAKTGRILGIASTTSFDPNIKNITSYMDPNISIGIEPGSTMKTYTYMAALETGNYDGSKLFKSGTYKTTDGTVIGDSNRGLGTITFDQGFAHSSNVGIINVINNYLTKDGLHDYFTKLGFGSRTNVFEFGVEKYLDKNSKETAGTLNFKYETEVYNAGFGQGILVTPIQNIKALTSIANNGVLLQPYIVDKVVDKNGKVLVENKRTELGTVASSETVSKIKDLMSDVVDFGTGTVYKMDGYDIIAKTGTAQIYSDVTKTYLAGEEQVIRGFAGMFPKDDPQIIIYASAKRPNKGYATSLAYVVKNVIEDIGTYYNIFSETKSEVIDFSYTMGSYFNKNINDVTESLENNNIKVVTIGTGDTIVNQYPNVNTSLTDGNRVFLVTNSSDIYIPNFKGWSKRDVITYLNLVNIPYTCSGNGYLISQSMVNIKYEDGSVELVFQEKYKSE